MILKVNSDSHYLYKPLFIHNKVAQQKSYNWLYIRSAQSYKRYKAVSCLGCPLTTYKSIYLMVQIKQKHLEYQISS